MKNPGISETAQEENCFTLEIPAESLFLDEAELSFALGYPGPEPPKEMGETIEEVKQQLPRLWEIRAGYRLLSMEMVPHNKEEILLGGVSLQTGAQIRSQLTRADQAALFVCTLGEGPERWAAELAASGDPVLSFIADTAASVLTENIAEQLHRYVETRMAASGRGITNRFSPGYCGWNVREQQRLFSLLPQRFCGIELNKSAFMEPRKSVSGIIGTGFQAQRRDYNCKKCENSQCIYRLKQNRKGKEKNDR